MFTVNEDMSIYVTRGDAVTIAVSAADGNGDSFSFQPGDLLRIKVFAKKDCETVVLQKDFPVTAVTETVEIYLNENETKIGEVISKPKDYWYEIELNPLSEPQTIIGYDEDGPRVFKLFPEGRDLTEDDPIIAPEDIPIVDDKLDLSSKRPVENQVIARAVEQIKGTIRTNEGNAAERFFAIEEDVNALESALAVERSRITNFSSLKEGSTTGDAELQDIRVTYDGEIYDEAGKAVRVQFQRVARHGHLISSSSDAVSFDTTKKTVTINDSFVVIGAKRYADVVATLDYSAAGTTAYVVYNKSAKAIECINYANYDSKIHIALFAFLPNSLNQHRKSVVSGISSYRVNGYLINGENNYVRKGVFVVRNSVGMSFDTVNNAVTIPNEAYLFYGGDRYTLKGASCGIPTTGSTQKYIVLNTETGGIECVTFTAYLYYKHIIICTITYKDMETPYSNDIPCGYSVDGVLYSKYGVSCGGDGVTLAYVSTAGNDGNFGSAEAPYRTIQKALNSGADKIIVEGGVYAETLTASNRASLSIVGGWSMAFDGDTAPERNKVIVECGENITFAEDTTGLIVAEYESSATDLIYKVFVTKVLNVADSGTRSKGYYVNLWKHLGIGNDVKLTPVLSLAECQATENTWFYDGTKIYANTANDGDFVLASDKESGGTFTNIADLTIEDVVFSHAPSDTLTLKKCNKVSLRNCEFNYSSRGDGLSMDYSNGVIENCKAYYNRNDGYNFHGYGDTTLNSCIGSYNFDDGASHHDGCTASFMGGEYAYNGKGGIAPAHGAVANMCDVISHHNGFGFYVESDDVVPLGKNVRLVGCVAYGNDYGLSVRNYHVLTYNCKFTDNDTPVLVRTDNEHTSHTIL